MIAGLLAGGAWVEERGVLAGLEVDGLGVVVVLSLALALFLGLWALRGVTGMLPMSRARRATVERLRPALELGAVVLYLLIALPIVVAGDELVAPVMMAAVIFGLVGVSWFAIRDVVGGVLLGAGGLCRVGDQVEIGGVRGRIAALGHRVLTLETEAGEEVFMPYGGLSRQAIVRTPRLEGGYRHGFFVELAEEGESVRVIAEIRWLAMSSHWASLVREPEVEAVSGGVRVVVFALGREHGGMIEAGVRRQLALASKRP